MYKKEFVFLKGKVKWFRALNPDDWGNWKTDFYPVPEALEKIRDMQTAQGGISGIKNTLKKDEDGYYITFRRPQSKMMKGKVVGFPPPVVMDGTAPPLADGTYPPLPQDTLVGNGSDATVKLEVYTHNTPGGGKARACRWEGARIDNLIPYEGKKDFDEATQKQLDGLSEQPKPLFEGF